jgi:drug/metabolite transporter (DMT)-like permease
LPVNLMSMKQLLYRHQNVPPMLVVWFRLVHGVIVRLMDSGTSPATLRRRRRRFLSVVGVVMSLLIQAVMLWLLHELVLLCIELMEVWAELAAKHLEIVLDESPS